MAEALRRYCPEEWKDFVSRKEKGGFQATELNEMRYPLHVTAADPENPWMHFTQARERLYETLIKRLKEGLIIASGYDSRLPANAGAIRIPGELWVYLVPDFKDSSASGPSMGFTAIRVSAGGPPRRRAYIETKAWMTRVKESTAWPPVSKREFEKEGRELLRDDFHKRCFDEVWSQLASTRMKKPGRKSKQKITT